MHKRTTPKILGHAKQLHRNMTPAEAKLWTYLRAHRMNDVHFRNQHAIRNYVVDFCAPRKKLIIELDGSQHLEQQEYDEQRTIYFKSQGYKVIRFWNWWSSRRPRADRRCRARSEMVFFRRTQSKRRPPYRDQQDTGILSIRGLDMPLENHSGLLDHRRLIEI